MVRRAPGCRPVREGPAGKRGGYGMTHHGGYGAHDMLLARMYDLLDEDQMRQLMVRMIESRIRMKEQHIEAMQYKIETYKMARDMLRAGMKQK
ncbi:MAG: hypothetical protein PWR21_1007 [Methanoculleus sp.]|nr:hypothetical protein [Methanoculleus sp.]